MSSTSLPDEVQRALDDFLSEAQAAFRDQLQSVVLFGSAAEGRLRPSSDVNLLVVLREYRTGDAARLHQGLLLARAAIRLQAMFLTESEIPAAIECFAQKFADILRRRQLLWG